MSSNVSPRPLLDARVLRFRCGCYTSFNPIRSKLTAELVFPDRVLVVEGECTLHGAGVNRDTVPKVAQLRYPHQGES